METHIILFIVGYVVSFLFGYSIAWRRATGVIASKTVDMLEENGYIKTKQVGNEKEIIKVQ
tara:strand:+ start:751 stop:933 length:183 start_codon:yes stop_codon:yes gene_type:complete